MIQYVGFNRRPSYTPKTLFAIATVHLLTRVITFAGMIVIMPAIYQIGVGRQQKGTLPYGPRPSWETHNLD